MKHAHAMPFGASLSGDGAARFRLWAPSQAGVALELQRGGEWSAHAMHRDADGWHELVLADVAAGARYRYRLPGGLCVPDPASRRNPDGVHGASEVVDPRRLRMAGHRLDRPALARGGDLRAARRHLHARGNVRGGAGPPARSRGARHHGGRADARGGLSGAARLGLRRSTALRPARGLRHAAGAQEPGRRGARDRADGADRRGLQPPSAPRATTCTPAAPSSSIRLTRRRGARPSTSTARMRAPCAISSCTTPSTGWRNTASTACAWTQCTRSGTTPGPPSSPRSAPRCATGPAATAMCMWCSRTTPTKRTSWKRDGDGRPLMATAQWNDDLHHAAHVMLTGETDGYYADYAQRPAAQFALALAQGFLYTGQPSVFRGGEPRGEPARQLPPCAFVSYLQTHDQIGNPRFRRAHRRPRRRRAGPCGARLRAAVAARPDAVHGRGVRSGDAVPVFLRFRSRAGGCGHRRPARGVRPLRRLRRRSTARAHSRSERRAALQGFNAALARARAGRRTHRPCIGHPPCWRCAAPS